MSDRSGLTTRAGTENLEDSTPGPALQDGRRRLHTPPESTWRARGRRD